MTTPREAIARAIYETGGEHPSGRYHWTNAPQAVRLEWYDYADAALAAIEAAGYRLTRVVRKERQPLVIDGSDYEERHKHDEERDE